MSSQGGVLVRIGLRWSVAVLLAVSAVSVTSTSGRAQTATSSARQLAPIPLDEALRWQGLVGFEASPDGALLAYAETESWRREREPGARFLRTGVSVPQRGLRVWLANTRTGQLTPVADGEEAQWSAFGPAWSPDGRTLAFVSSRDGFARIWLWDRGTNQYRRLSDVVIPQHARRVWMEAWRLLQWTPDGRTIVVRMVPEGMSVDQFVEYTRMQPTGSNRDQAPGKSTVTVYPRSAGAAADSNHPPFTERYAEWLCDIGAIDVATGRVTRLVSRVHTERYDLSPDGRHIAWFDVDGLRIIETASGKETNFDTAPPSVLPRSEMRWAPTSDAIAHVVDGVVRRLPIAGKASALSPGSAVQALPVWTPDGRALYAVDGKRLLRLQEGREPVLVTTFRDARFASWLFDGRSDRLFTKLDAKSIWLWMQRGEAPGLRLEEVILATGEVRPMVANPANFHEDAKIAARLLNKDFIYRYQDASHPINLWIAYADGRENRQISQEGAAYSRYELGEHRLIRWLTDDGEERRGALMLPAGYKEGTRVPMVVWVYGGTSSVLGTLDTFGMVGYSKNLQMLATRGYAVLVPESVLHIGTPMLDLAKNVLPGVSKVVELGIADERRLGVYGHSYGGYSTLALIVQTPRFRAAIASGGASNLVMMWGTSFDNGASENIPWSESKDGQGQGRMGASPWEVRESYIENSPFFYLDRVRTPLMLMHGDIDPVPVEQADQVYFALRRLGKPVEYARYGGMGHNATDPGNERDYFERIIGWFDRQLKGDVTAASR
jgi:dipeptidyl aminopeptidase/acylaminoacyl peptidase